MAFIYKITNDINGKVYIGKTNYSIEKRFKEHCRDALKRRCEKRPLYSAMRKYGFEHFHIEQLEEISRNEASEREKYWVERYGSFHNGYNATMGGDGKNYVDYNELVNLYNEGRNIREIHRLTGKDVLTIRKALNNVGIMHDDIEKRARDNKLKKPVAKIDPDSNKVIAVYPSVTAADKKNGYSHNIPKSCKNRTSIIQGYRWEYIQISDPVHEEDG